MSILGLSNNTSSEHQKHQQGVMFLSDDSSIANLHPSLHQPPTITNATTSVTQSQPTNNGKNTLRRRKLNWRVGPLQKKRNPNRYHRTTHNQINNQINYLQSRHKKHCHEDNSIAEKTVKSNHTFHSIETVKVGNDINHYRHNHPSLLKTNSINSIGSGSSSGGGGGDGYGRNQQEYRQQIRQPLIPLPLSAPPTSTTTFTTQGIHHVHTPVQSKRKMYNHSPATIESTIASTPSPHHSLNSFCNDNHDDDDDDENGTVIAPLDSSQVENTHRTIGLFLYDSKSKSNKHDITPTTGISNQSSVSSRGTMASSKNRNIPSITTTTTASPVIHHKRKGLPPRSPHVGNKLLFSSHHVMMRNNQNNTSSNSTGFSATNINTGADSGAGPNNDQDSQYNHNFKDDDGSESSQSGGPLWQLAKLQALAEGPIPSSPSFTTTTSDNHNHPHRQRHLGGTKTSSNMSVTSFSQASSTGSTDPQEIQRQQAERNLRAIHTLAQQHLKFNEIPEAISVLQEMLRGVRELHGEEHYRVGTVLHNLATVFMNIGQYKNASIYCRQSVEVRKRCLGSLHPDLAVSLSQLGVVHLELEEYDEAIKNFKRALVIRRQNLLGDASSGKIARLLNNIGCACYESGKLEEAVKSFEEALMVQKTLMHGALPNTTHVSEIDSRRSRGLSDQQVKQQNVNHILLGIASTLCNLGSVKLRLKKYDDAIVALEEALLLQQSILADDHPIVQSTKDSIDIVDSSRANHNYVKRVGHGSLQLHMIMLNDVSLSLFD